LYVPRPLGGREEEDARKKGEENLGRTSPDNRSREGKKRKRIVGRKSPPRSEKGEKAEDLGGARPLSLTR